MPLTIVCTCGQNYSVDEQYAGQQVPCPVCQQPIQIPGFVTPAPPPARQLTVSCVCGQYYSIDERYAGQQVPCSACQRPIDIPVPAAMATYPTNAVQGLCEAELVEEEPAPRRGGGGALAALLGTVLFILVIGGGMAAAVWWMGQQDAKKLASAEDKPKEQEKGGDTPKVSPAVKEDDRQDRKEEKKESDKDKVVAVVKDKDKGDKDKGKQVDKKDKDKGKDEDKGKGKEEEKDKDKKAKTSPGKLSPPSGVPWKGHEASILAVAVDPAGNNVWTASGGADDKGVIAPDSTLRRWDAKTGMENDRLELTARGIGAAAFDADCKRAAVALPGKAAIELWDLAAKKKLATLDEHRKPVRALAFSADGRLLLSGGEDRLLIVWDLATKKAIHTLVGHTNTIDAVAVSPDGKAAVSGGRDLTARLWDLDKGEQKAELSGHGDIVWATAFSHDGKFALSGGGMQQVSPTVFVAGARDYEVRCWDAGRAKEKSRARPLAVAVTALAFSPDSRRYLAGGNDGSLRLWQLTTNKEVKDLKGHSARVRGAAFFAEGRKAVSVSDDQTIRLWDLPADLPELARDVKGSDAALRTAALAELTRLGADAKPVVPDLFASLTVGGDAWKDKVLELLKTFSPLDAEHVARLEAVLREKKYLAGRRYAVEELTKLGEGARPAARTLLAAVADEDLQVRRAALAALAPIIDEVGGKAFEPLLAALRDRDPTLREQAEKAIEKLGKPPVEHLALVRGLLAEKDAALKRFGLKALGEMGDAAAPALDGVAERATGDSAAEVRKQAFEALAKIAPADERTVAAAKKGLDDGSASVYRQAASVLAAAGDVPALAAALEHDDDQVRKTADEALQKATFTKKHLLLLIKLVESKREAARLRGVEALGGLGAEAAVAVPSLSAALKDAGAQERKKILALLVKIGPKAKSAGREVVKLLETKKKVLDAEDRARNLEICEVLTRIEAPQIKDAVPSLLAQLKPANGEDLADETAIAHREKVRKLIVQVGKPAVDQILKDVEYRYAGGRGDDAVLNAVARLALVKALTEMGSVAYSGETMRVLARLRRADREPVPEVREQAKAAYAAIQKK